MTSMKGRLAMRRADARGRVRRCRIRDDQRAAIALGTAKSGSLPVNDAGITAGNYSVSGGIRFEDNTILNSLIGFNTDTGSIGPLWFTNNASSTWAPGAWWGSPTPPRDTSSTA